MRRYTSGGTALRAKTAIDANVARPCAKLPVNLRPLVDLIYNAGPDTMERLHFRSSMAMLTPASNGEMSQFRQGKLASRIQPFAV
jgi:hypothetical protein